MSLMRFPALAFLLALPLFSEPLLWYSRPAEEWVEALPVGNGRLGGMVFGRTGTERIQLNEDTVWAGAPQERDIAGAFRHLPEIRKMLFEGKFVEAERRIEGTLMAAEGVGAAGIGPPDVTAADVAALRELCPEL